jgi:hypothetical protein
MQKLFLLTMITAMIAGFGLMFVLIAIAYTRDIASIMRTPTLIWQYVCGIPVNSSMTVPLLVSIGGICLLGASSLWWWLRRSA